MSSAVVEADRLEEQPQSPDADQVAEAARADRMLQDAQQEEREDARRFVGMGVGIGAIGALSAVAFGAVCPVCVVAAPALIATGVVKHVRSGRKGR
ncbi:MAG: hypothetical protein JRI23_32870 [Deltaproteobacteria bacterium]|jgi:hypothetical protein|nr:hypothetical protein [Deltaproteobacteria bacterium]MBW2537046.1 hypothetical protein [Deltaproteobacteria bacterium]